MLVKDLGVAMTQILAVGALVGALTLLILNLADSRFNHTKFLFASAIFTGIFAALSLQSGMLASSITSGQKAIGRLTGLM